MELKHILTPARTRAGFRISSKKRAIEELARLIAEDSGLNQDSLFEQFLERERLGSTGIGEGIAIPHCRAKECKSIVAAVLSLDQAVDFAAQDEQPVDLLCALVVPAEEHSEHLNTLAHIAERMQNADFRQRLRNAKDDNSLYQIAVEAA